MMVYQMLLPVSGRMIPSDIQLLPVGLHCVYFTNAAQMQAYHIGPLLTSIKYRLFYLRPRDVLCEDFYHDFSLPLRLQPDLRHDGWMMAERENLFVMVDGDLIFPGCKQLIHQFSDEQDDTRPKLSLHA